MLFKERGISEWTRFRNHFKQTIACSRSWRGYCTVQGRQSAIQCQSSLHTKQESDWNLIVCEERAGGFIQNVEQPGYMKIWRILLADVSSGSLKEEKVTLFRVVGAQEINRLNGRKR